MYFQHSDEDSGSKVKARRTGGGGKGGGETTQLPSSIQLNYNNKIVVDGHIFKNLLDEDKEFIKEYNGRVKRNESVEDMTIPNGVKIKKRE